MTAGLLFEEFVGFDRGFVLAFCVAVLCVMVGLFILSHRRQLRARNSVLDNVSVTSSHCERQKPPLATAPRADATARTFATPYRKLRTPPHASAHGARTTHAAALTSYTPPPGPAAGSQGSSINDSALSATHAPDAVHLRPASEFASDSVVHVHGDEGGGGVERDPAERALAGVDQEPLSHLPGHGARVPTAREEAESCAASSCANSSVPLQYTQKNQAAAAAAAELPAAKLPASMLPAAKLPAASDEATPPGPAVTPAAPGKPDSPSKQLATQV